MKHPIVFGGLLLASSVASADPFRNLDFELANTNTSSLMLSPGPPSLVGQGPAVDLLPAWQYLVGTNNAPTTPLAYIGFNLPVPETGGAAIVESSIFGDSGNGKYLLEFYTTAAIRQSAEAIRQTGDIPADAKYLSYEGGGLEVSVNGTELELYGVYGSPYRYSHYDISPYAGQEVTIELKLPWLQFGNTAFLDNVAFSETIIPEPGALSLFCLGGAALVLRHVRKCRRRRRFREVR